MNCASFPKAAVSPNSELSSPLHLQQQWFVSEYRLRVLGVFLHAPLDGVV